MTSLNKGRLRKAAYIEELAEAIKDAKPYYADSGAKLRGLNSRINQFPKSPGVYLILRKVELPDKGYQTKGVNTKFPLVLYVGKTTAKRTIRERLHDHFGRIIMSYQGSQFRKFLYQVIQNEEALKTVLWSDSTLIACVPIEASDEVIDYVENLAIQVFKPRFNIKDR